MTKYEIRLLLSNILGLNDALWVEYGVDRILELASRATMLPPDDPLTIMLVCARLNAVRIEIYLKDIQNHLASLATSARQDSPRIENAVRQIENTAKEIVKSNDVFFNFVRSERDAWSDRTVQTVSAYVEEAVHNIKYSSPTPLPPQVIPTPMHQSPPTAKRSWTEELAQNKWTLIAAFLGGMFAKIIFR